MTDQKNLQDRRPEAMALRPPTALAPGAALTVPVGWHVEGLPPLVRRAGPKAAERLVEFFTAQIRNANTRAAYGTAMMRFFAWCDARRLELDRISPIAVATYIDAMQETASAPTVKQHLAAIRHLFDWLVVGQVVPANPALLPAREAVVAAAPREGRQAPRPAGPSRGGGRARRLSGRGRHR